MFAMINIELWFLLMMVALLCMTICVV